MKNNELHLGDVVRIVNPKESDFTMYIVDTLHEIGSYSLKGVYWKTGKIVRGPEGVWGANLDTFIGFKHKFVDVDDNETEFELLSRDSYNKNPKNILKRWLNERGEHTN